MSRAALDLDAGWATRWATILDRIEHRQPDIGLRFWGPPLWLEVTMTGPDSDLWPAMGEQATAWDWQSSAPCVEVAALADEGADDDRLLAVVSRYTIENLILNAVHEIGEWFRFDGGRLFPAHGSGAAHRDDQGNGAVTVQLEFGPAPRRPGAVPAGPARDPHRGRHLASRLAEAAAPERFTYLPGTTIAYDEVGPVIRRWSNAEPTTAWGSAWSSSMWDAVDADGPAVIAFVARDVHGALVAHEANLICQAFHVDGCRPWRLAVPESALGRKPPDSEADDSELLSILVGYTDTSDLLRECRGRGPVRLLRKLLAM